MQLRIVQLEQNVEGKQDNDRFGVYRGATLLYDFTGQDALSVVVEWRSEEEGEPSTSAG